MYRLKHLFFIYLILFLSGCYESETVIKLNPDGSGIITTNMDFDNATEEQRLQIKSFLSLPNVQSDFDEDKMKEKFPPPYFEIVELVKDREALRFKSTVKFTDINRLLAVDPEDGPLKGLNFEAQGEDILFKIIRSSQDSGYGQNIKLKGTMGKFAGNIYAKETINIVNTQTGDGIVFFHEYKGDKIEKEFTWEDRLKAPGHTIKRAPVKYNFADYPVLSKVTGEIKNAAWTRTKSDKSSMAQSRLDIELLVPFPQSDEFSYLGYDRVYLISGEFSGGAPLEIDSARLKGLKRFNENNLAGLGKFKLPMGFSFPKNPVEWMESLRLRVRLLRGKDSKRIEIGGIVSGGRSEPAPFKFTINEITNGGFSMDISGPIARIDKFLIKTKRGNVFPLNPSGWPGFDTHGNAIFPKFLPLENAALLVDSYDFFEYVWLDIDVPKLDFRQKIEIDIPAADHRELLKNLFPEYKDFPEIPENIYQDKILFESYWDSLNDEHIIPALLVVSSNLKLAKDNQVYYWYQADLGRKLKERAEFYEAHKGKIADCLFQLFLEMPDHSSTAAIPYFLSNAGLAELVRGKALQAVKDKRLKNAIGVFFKNGLSDTERNILSEAFENSDDRSVRREILKALAGGPDGDLKLAQRVLEDKREDVYVREYAFEVLLDRKQDFSGSDILPYVADSVMRQSVMQKISQRLSGGYRSPGEISKERLTEALKPMVSVFEDLSEQDSKYQADIAKRCLEAIR